MPDQTKLIATTRQVLSPWVTLMSRTIERAGAEPQIFHSLEQSDYVSVLAVAPDGSIPLVRQYRPAIQRMTLELPGGLIDAAESPSTVAARELYEETGYRNLSEPLLLSCLIPDTGRLENRLWCFFVTAAPDSNWTAEPGVERVIYSRAQLHCEVLNGEFDHALHIAVLALAQMRGCFQWTD